MIWTVVLMAVVLLGGAGLLRRGMRWGSTSEERARPSRIAANSPRRWQ